MFSMCYPSLSVYYYPNNNPAAFLYIIDWFWKVANMVTSLKTILNPLISQSGSRSICCIRITSKGTLGTAATCIPCRLRITARITEGPAYSSTCSGSLLGLLLPFLPFKLCYPLSFQLFLTLTLLLSLTLSFYFSLPLTFLLSNPLLLFLTCLLLCRNSRSFLSILS